MLDGDLALRWRGALAPGDCAKFVNDVYKAREHWTPAFEGVQYTLGRAWYTHLEEDLEDDYFANARDSDDLVQSSLPGLQESILQLFSEIVRAPIVRRPAWCGPGVHIFPAGEWLSENGGEIHYDTEGLSDEQLATRAPALSLIVMLQPPERGGGLRVWDQLYDGVAEVEAAPPRSSVIVPYAVGDAVVIDSYRLHQIQPFAGARDRISATAHAVYAQDHWEAWF
jgi:hypothetical protein